MRTFVFVLALAASAAPGCVSQNGFQCESDVQCEGLPGGACEASGFCSIGDPTCPSGRRYAEASGASSGQCVGGGAGGHDAASGADAPASGSDGSPDAGPPDANPIDAAPPADAGDVLVTFTPSNIPAAQLTAGTNKLTLQASDGIVEIDTDSGAITRLSDFADLRPIGVGFTKINQSGGNPDIGIFSMTELRIDAGATLRVRGEAALALAIGGDVLLEGVLDARGGRGSVAANGSGGFDGGAGASCDGAGPGGGRAGKDDVDVGGGGGGHLAAGGAGGARMSQGGADGGTPYGNTALTPLVGGSGGGCGGGAAPRAAGGGGGGALQISARGTIWLAETAVINVAGGGGSGGGADNGGGGGGAGGSILVEGGRIVVLGTLAANGGGGGAGADKSTTGANGQPGQASAQAASGGAASGEGTAGGAGGAGTIAAGQPGITAGPPGTDNAGGGGGAAGRILLRSDDIQRPGVISPLVGLTQSPL